MATHRNFFVHLLPLAVFGLVLQFSSIASAQMVTYPSHDDYFNIGDNYNIRVQEWGPNATPKQAYDTTYFVLARKIPSKTILNFKMPLPWEGAYCACFLGLFIVPFSILAFFTIWLWKRIKAKKYSN